jgi:hypothetical protein
MSDVVALQSRSKGAALVEQYRNLLSFEYVERVPPEHLPTLLKAIDASLRPASPEDVSKAVAVLVASFKIPGNLEDPPTFTRLMKNDLAVYPFDILDEAIKRARRTFKWLPSIAEMIEICDELMGARKSNRDAVGWIISQRRLHEEQRREQAERANRGRRLREEQSARIRALHGDAAAVTPEEIELAGRLRPIMHWPKIFAWHESLGSGELWAVTFCRRLALAERAKRAELNGLIPPGHAAAITRLIMVDEPAARSQIDALPAQSIESPIECRERKGGDFETAVTEIEVAAWRERGIFESDLSAPPPLAQNERFGPPPDATLNLAEHPDQAAAELKRAAEVLRAQNSA